MRFGLSPAKVVRRPNMSLSLVALQGLGLGHRRHP
jgi:hypothetical protein